MKQKIKDLILKYQKEVKELEYKKESLKGIDKFENGCDRSKLLEVIFDLTKTL